PLSGPARGGIAPIGQARYRDRFGDRDTLFQLFNVNLPNYTRCTVWVNGSPLQTQRIFAGIALFPHLATLAGDVVPFIAAGDTFPVTAEGIGPIMTGVFGGAAPALPAPLIEMETPLTGPALGGVVPDGIAAYTVFVGLNNQLYRLFTCDVLG